MARPLIYVAHPYGGCKTNLIKAVKSVGWLNYWVQDFWFWAPWIGLCDALDETPANRSRGLHFSRVAVEISDGLVRIDAGEPSAGCDAEERWARAAGKPAVTIPTPWANIEASENRRLRDIVRTALLPRPVA